MSFRTDSDRRIILILFSACFTVRLIFLMRFAASPLFVPVSGGNDCWLYLSIAQRCAAGHWLPDGVFQYMPLYSWILGVIALFAGSGTLLAAAFLGNVLDSITTILIYRLARSLGAPRPAAIIGAMMFVLYPLAITYSAMNMPNSMNAFFLISIATVLSRFNRNTEMRSWILAGLLSGVACLSFAGMLLMTLVVAVWFAMAFIRQRLAALPNVLVFVLCAALPVIPISVHNFHAEGKFVLITAHGGFNFYLGNHDGATGYPMMLPGFRGDRGNLLADARDEAERLEGRKLSASEFARHWNDRAKKFIRENPGKEVRLLGSKFLKFWNNSEYDDLRMLPMLRLTGVAFTTPGWPVFGFISALGFAGLLTARRCGLVRLMTLVAMFSIVSFFITSRYRLTVVPLLCVLSAVGFRPFALWIHHRPAFARAAAIWCCALIAGLAIAFRTMAGSNFEALDYYNTAAHSLEKALQTGDGALVEDALRYAKDGLCIDASSPDLHFVAGNAFFGLGRTNEAVSAFAETIRLNPRHAQAYFNIAVVLANQGLRDAAISNATRAVEIDPAYIKAKTFLETLTRDGGSTGGRVIFQ